MKKSKFNLSHNASLTADMGKLIPFMVLDCLPNDSFQVRLQSFVRAQPMLAPLMHMVNLYTQYWFVPYRILWDNWTDFITGGLSGSSAPTFPTVKLSSVATSSLADYFGIPVTEKELEVSALPFRAYAEIWNTRYRDEDLQSEVGISYGDGVDSATSTDLLQPSWAKDYFTTARPFTQRGSQISVPVNSITTNEVVKATSTLTFIARQDLSSTSTGTFHHEDMGETYTSTRNWKAVLQSIILDKSLFSDGFTSNDSVIDVTFNSFSVSASGTGSGSVSVTVNSLSYGSKIKAVFSVTYSGFPTVQYTGGDSVTFSSSSASIQFGTRTSSEAAVTSSNVTLAFNTPSASVVYNYGNAITSSVNIRDLRLSSALQRYQERSLEYGNRYEEFIQREFGIRPRDARIQRPEYLGGGKSVLQISEVLQTAEGNNTGVGTMRGHGVSAFSSRGIRFRCPEHGVIIGLLSIRPHAVYTQGLNRFWRKFSKLDYFVPELANVGMQEVFSSELYANGENYSKIFGYAPRYQEYRTQPNRISGEFRDILDFWNLARKFDSEPVLNSDFITMNPSKRVFAEQTQNSFLIMLRNDVKAFRVVPKKAKNILK